jgi:hypothetical protein
MARTSRGVTCLPHKCGGWERVAALGGGRVGRPRARAGEPLTRRIHCCAGGKPPCARFLLDGPPRLPEGHVAERQAAPPEPPPGARLVCNPAAKQRCGGRVPRPASPQGLTAGLGPRAGWTGGSWAGCPPCRGAARPPTAHCWSAGWQVGAGWPADPPQVARPAQKLRGQAGTEYELLCKNTKSPPLCPAEAPGYPQALLPSPLLRWQPVQGQDQREHPRRSLCMESQPGSQGHCGMLLPRHAARGRYPAPPPHRPQPPYLLQRRARC